MREIRQSGSEGGAAQTNASFLPLSSQLQNSKKGVIPAKLVLDLIGERRSNHFSPRGSRGLVRLGAGEVSRVRVSIQEMSDPGSRR